METKKACCVFGHRKVTGKEKLKQRLDKIFESLIVNDKVDTFYLGSRSEFDSLCREVLAYKKEKYGHIKRIYVRAEYPDISENYKNYLLESCEETYFPTKARNAGKAVYVERNHEMINNSDICIIYYKVGLLPPEKKKGKKTLISYQQKSGTEIAYKYAIQKNKIIINLAETEK